MRLQFTEKGEMLGWLRHELDVHTIRSQFPQSCLQQPHGAEVGVFERAAIHRDEFDVALFELAQLRLDLRQALNRPTAGELQLQRV